MSTKFTPAPWFAHCALNRCPRGELVARISSTISIRADGVPAKDGEADAHLIAAAPELYAAPENARDYVASELHLERQKFEGYEQASDIASIEADIATIDAALAKARGES